MDHLSEWKKHLGVDSAEWYPSDNDAVNVAWCSFMTKRTAPYAMDAIKEILNAGLSLPAELNPFVLDACAVWSETRGNKQPVSARRTKESWEGLIWQVHLRRMKGETRDAAIESVADKNFKAVDTLKRHYKSNKYAAVKESVFIGLAHELLRQEISKNREMLAAFVERYPGFIEALNNRI